MNRPLERSAPHPIRARRAAVAALAVATLAAGAGLGASALRSTVAAPHDPTSPTVGAERERARRPGGDTTVALEQRLTMLRPAANLDDPQKARFYAGKALATQPWVRAPSVTDARDGLGPLYNAPTCLACHVNGGRGRTTESASETAVATVARISVPGEDVHGGPLPDPVYGAQIQTRSISLAHQLRGRPGADAYRDDGPEAEARLALGWTRSRYTYPDGANVEMRAPSPRLSELAYGPLHPEARLTLRHAPSLAGVGLLERIPEAAIETLADPLDRDGDGVSGRVQRVWDLETSTKRLGRFGWKADQPTVRAQVAAAFVNDIGITSPLFPGQPCTDAQTRCLEAPHGNDHDGHEISAELLELVAFFNASIGVPERRAPEDPRVARGGELFAAIGCAACHAPHFVTEDDRSHPHLSGQAIAPYTDLLLHDLGEALADGREAFEASGSEWRTAPLWGVGLALEIDDGVGFLHDGRARTVEEAILWHGGEATRSRDGFAALDVGDREAVLAFVRSL